MKKKVGEWPLSPTEGSVISGSMATTKPDVKEEKKIVCCLSQHTPTYPGRHKVHYRRGYHAL